MNDQNKFDLEIKFKLNLLNFGSTNFKFQLPNNYSIADNSQCVESSNVNSQATCDTFGGAVRVSDVFAQISQKAEKQYTLKIKNLEVSGVAEEANANFAVTSSFDNLGVYY